jgi:hypothetical protein
MSLPLGLLFKILVVFSILSLLLAALIKISNKVLWSQAPCVSIEIFSLKQLRTSLKVSESVSAK